MIWPLLLILGLRYVKERPRSGPFRPRLARLTLLLGVVSAIEMAVLYHPGFDPSRVYYGTDTRAFGLLFGAALACVWPSRKLSSQVGRHAGGVMDVVGTIGLIGIVLMIWRTTEYSQFLYRGGFVLLSVFTVMAIAGLTHPAAKLSGVMGGGPMRWLGVRSYGIYLWHAPIIALTTPNADHGVQLWRATLQVAASIGIAALSWKYLEDPIRHGGLGALRTMFGSGRRRAPRFTASRYGSSGGGYGSAAYAPTLQLSQRRRRSLPAPGVMALSGAVLLAVICLSGALASPPFKPIVSDASLDVAQLTGSNSPPPPTTKAHSGSAHPGGKSSAGKASGHSSAGVGKSSSGGSSGKSSGGSSGKSSGGSNAGAGTKAHKGKQTVAGTNHAPMTSCTSVVHIGDSTSDGLVSNDYLPDKQQQIPAQYARVGVKTSHMEITGGTSIIETLPGTINALTVAHDQISDGYNGCWVIALGTNDVADVYVGSNVPLTQRIDEMMKAIHGQDVMWVNDKTLLSSGPYAESNMVQWNQDLVAACRHYPNMRVYDWADVVKDKWFISDGIHYTSAGYAARAHLFANALAKAFPANGKEPKSCVVHTDSPNIPLLGVGTSSSGSSGTSGTTADDSTTTG